jgi:hypothetical protein
VLSPHVYLLGLIFADRAFDRVDGEEVVVSASQLLQIRIREDSDELKLQIDPAMGDVPVFRMSERTLNGINISPAKPLPYSKLLSWAKKMGEIAGIQLAALLYNLCYGSKIALDHSGTSSCRVCRCNKLT